MIFNRTSFFDPAFVIVASVDDAEAEEEPFLPFEPPLAPFFFGGFVFASTVSYQLEKPFILLRKKNKLPAEVHSVDFELEYGTATIEVHKDSIEKGEKILIIDDLIATGGTAEAAAKIVEISGGEVAGFIFVINLFDLPGEKLLKEKK